MNPDEDTDARKGLVFHFGGFRKQMNSYLNVGNRESS